MENNAMRTHSTVNGLGGLHHQCEGCGGSCQGAVVELLDEAEAQRIEQISRALSIDGAVLDGRLRQIDGTCVFLSADQGCRIHRNFGFEQKPQLCKQFPLVALRAEDGVRLGVDPACYHSWKGWESGPEIQSSHLVLGRVERSERDVALERQLVHFCESGAASIASLAHWLCGSRPSDHVGDPPGFTNRIWSELSTAPWGEIVQRPGLPSAMLAAFKPVIERLEQGGDPVNLSLQPSREMEWALEAVRRFLYLRLYAGIPTVAEATLWVLMGIVACNGAGLTGVAFGRALAGWFRILRYPSIRNALIPDKNSLSNLVVQRQ